MPRTEESKLMSQRRRSSAALRTTGRDPERPRRAAIADMSMAAGGLVVEIGAQREREREGETVSALEGRNSVVDLDLWLVLECFWRGREMTRAKNMLIFAPMWFQSRVVAWAWWLVSLLGWADLGL